METNEPLFYGGVIRQSRFTGSCNTPCGAFGMLILLLIFDWRTHAAPPAGILQEAALQKIVPSTAPSQKSTNQHVQVTPRGLFPVFRKKEWQRKESHAAAATNKHAGLLKDLQFPVAAFFCLSQIYFFIVGIFT